MELWKSHHSSWVCPKSRCMCTSKAPSNQGQFELAQRNGIKLPFDTPEQVRASYKFDDLTSFLDAYYDGMSVLQTAEDFPTPSRWPTSARWRRRICAMPKSSSIHRRTPRAASRSTP